jgi:eukaryotic-like serine/threonine-protein kinase
VNPDLPPELERIIGRALEKDRELRYQHAADMRSELLRLKRDTSTGQAAVTSSEPVPIAPESGSQVAGPPAARGSGSSPALAPSPSSSAGKLADVRVAAGRKPWKILVPIAALILAALIAGGRYYRSHRAAKPARKGFLMASRTKDVIGAVILI